MNKRLTIFLLVLLIFSVGLYFWYQSELKAVNPQNPQTEIFVIHQGETIREIANNLEKEGLIRNPLAFFLLVRQMGISQSIQAGDFRLNPGMNAKVLAETLTKGTLDVWITALEGWRNEEIAAVLAQKLGMAEIDFLAEAQTGYMFPDTYLIPKTASASAVVNIFLRNFAVKTGADFSVRAKANGLSAEETVILASIVEREAQKAADRPIVAGILLNRWRDNHPLQADAAIQYALGYQTAEKSWWKKHLSLDDLKIDSPYNVYKNRGLPPAPISNPGLAAINAVLNPAKTDYYYYLSDNSGSMRYAKTLEEHNANIRKYIQSL